MVEKERLHVLQNEIGKVYGDFKVVGYRHERGKVDYLKCECVKCGRTRSIRFSQIKPLECPHAKVRTVFDKSFIGRKKNSLTVTDFDGRKFTCRCDCGNVLQVFPADWNNGQVKSCGCLSAKARVKHSPELDRLRIIYNGMVQRCTNPKSTGYSHYGGRGIKICEEWLSDFNKFAEWALENGFQMDLTIDRVDNDGNYEPDNCRWATKKEQVCNQRPKKGGIYFRGAYRNKSDIARILRLPPSTLHDKIKSGMTMSEIEVYAVNANHR